MNNSRRVSAALGAVGMDKSCVTLDSQCINTRHFSVLIKLQGVIMSSRESRSLEDLWQLKHDKKYHYCWWSAPSFFLFWLETGGFYSLVPLWCKSWELLSVLNGRYMIDRPLGCPFISFTTRRPDDLPLPEMDFLSTKWMQNRFTAYNSQLLVWLKKRPTSAKAVR